MAVEKGEIVKCNKMGGSDAVFLQDLTFQSSWSLLMELSCKGTTSMLASCHPVSNGLAEPDVNTFNSK